jgi:alpha-galactosidase
VTFTSHRFTYKRILNETIDLKFIDSKKKQKMKLKHFYKIILLLLVSGSLSAQTVWLDELDLSVASQGWGVP